MSPTIMPALLIGQSNIQPPEKSSNKEWMQLNNIFVKSSKLTAQKSSKYKWKNSPDCINDAIFRAIIRVRFYKAISLHSTVLPVQFAFQYLQNI